LLILRRVRECQVYCELVSYDTPWEKIAPLHPKGFILSGGPASVYDPGAPLAPDYIYESGLPVLGICYGMHVITHQLGGQVAVGTKKEYGHATLQVMQMPPGFTSLAYTENCPVAVMGNDKGIFGLQFHPEVAHTPQGKIILQNFLYNVCGCQGNWTATNFITESVDRISEQVGRGRVICALSGGVR
jgi:GMP synthase (glutamine-hydrolysing)